MSVVVMTMRPCGFNNFSSDAKNSMLFSLDVFDMVKLKLELAYDAGCKQQINV